MSINTTTTARKRGFLRGHAATEHARRELARRIYTDAARAVQNDDRAGQIRALLQKARYWATEYRTPVDFSHSSSCAKSAAQSVDLWHSWREDGGHVVTCSPDRRNESEAWFNTSNLETAALAGLGIGGGDSASGLVRLLVIPDECADFDDLVGDNWTDDRGGVAARKRLEQRIRDEGAFGVVPQYRLTAEHDWTDTDGDVWGFVGDDWCGAAEDFASCALRALEDARAEYLANLRQAIRAEDLSEAVHALTDSARMLRSRQVDDRAEEVEAVAVRLDAAGDLLRASGIVHAIKPFGRLSTVSALELRGNLRCSNGPDCPECRGYGYAARLSDRHGWRIERDDSCAVFRTDDEARLAFALDFASGDEFAADCARRLLGVTEGGAA